MVTTPRVLVLSLFVAMLTCGPAAGQSIGAEFGAAFPVGSFGLVAQSGYQAGVVAAMPNLTSHVGVAGRLGYKSYNTRKNRSRWFTAFIGPEISYQWAYQYVAQANVGGGVALKTRSGDEPVRSFAVRSRIAVGVETRAGVRLTLGPIYGVTMENDRWWGGTAMLRF